MRAVEDSLRRLQVDTIDLYQCHYPDTATPIDETLRAFEDLVSAGKVRYIGASNYNTELLQEALDVARAESLPRFVSLQPNYSLVKRAEFEQGPMAVCQAEGLGVIPYSPLAAGFLTGKYRRGQKVESQRLNRVSDYLNDRGYAVLDAMDAIAASHDVPLASVALAWMLANPLITAPIVGANTPQQLADQLPAVDLKLTEAELDSLNTASAAF
jgi:aryl-alcohol dehydrogenase-like predicted oxidoreductase